MVRVGYCRELRGMSEKMMWEARGKYFWRENRECKELRREKRECNYLWEC
jgi:hypothetical protein